MARIHYLRALQALPQDLNPDALWEYYKQWWNTSLGTASKDESNVKYFKFTGKESTNGTQKQKPQK
jgi:hypothetical protein